ncbi:MAG TPA: hypothetical protein ENK97_00570 [Campylobacteraceae bacterium]|nr:hypothetical protein [Campylobacteraceae bacterium]
MLKTSESETIKERYIHISVFLSSSSLGISFNLSSILRGTNILLPVFEQYLGIFRSIEMVACVDADEMLEEILENDPAKKAEWEKEYKLKDDPRITSIGKFLRRTSLDELPQLFNVFQGKMSLVGPRPIIDAEIPKYGEYFDYFTAVKPGITGLWQVSGRNDIPYDERVRLDVWYVRNWSMELDIMILVKTAAIIMMRKGSY